MLFLWFFVVVVMEGERKGGGERLWCLDETGDNF